MYVSTHHYPLQPQDDRLLLTKAHHNFIQCIYLRPNCRRESSNCGYPPGMHSQGAAGRGFQAPFATAVSKSSEITLRQPLTERLNHGSRRVIPARSVRRSTEKSRTSVCSDFRSGPNARPESGGRKRHHPGAQLYACSSGACSTDTRATLPCNYLMSRWRRRK